MSDTTPSTVTAEPHRLSITLPQWGWFLTATFVLVVSFVGLSVWLPYHREQQVGQMIERWGGNVTGTETSAPDWLQRLVGIGRLNSVKVFDRIISVQLSRSTITDEDLVQLRHLKNLRNLSLENTGVTDAGLPQLSKLQTLQILSLVHTQVTDGGLPNFTGMMNLRKLYLDGTWATETSTQRLRVALPDCDIFR
jgi:Leucine-rich repeat (LRR) protein